MSAPGPIPSDIAVPQLNAEVFSIPLGESRYLIYAPLRKTAFVANDRLVNFIAELKEGRYDKEADPEGVVIKFLRQVAIVDSGSETLPVTSATGSPLPTAITLLLTTTCNLRCTYCYASAGETAAKFMSLETAKRGIDFIAANAAKKNFIAKYAGQPGVKEIHVTYHGGGEPTAHWSVLTDSFAYAQQKAQAIGLRVNGNMTSNGVLRDDKKIDWVIANLDKVMISFDGLPSIQDKQRFTAGGRGSSEAVMHTLRRFDAVDYPYILRLTATEAFLDQLPEAIAFIGEHFKPQSIHIEPAYLIGRGQDAPSANTTRFINAYRAARAIATKYGLVLEYSPANLDRRSNHFCGITQDAFSLSADGNVSACYSSFSEEDKLADVFFYGKPDTQSKGYVFDMPTLDKLRNWAVHHQDFCNGCFAKWHCAGDCHYNTLSVSGQSEFAGSERCHITRELTKDELLARIAAAGGHFWHESA